MSCCGSDERLTEYFREPLTWKLNSFDDDDLAATAMLAGHGVERHAERAKEALVRGLIMSEENLDIRTLASHLGYLDDLKLSMGEVHMMLSALRYLELLPPEDEHYPYLKSHEKLYLYSDSSRIPYHQNDELIRLVHEYPEKHEEIVNLIHVQGITDVGLVREHVANAAPVLSDGLL